MAVQLNHTIVTSRDKEASARFLTEILGLPKASRFGPFLVVELNNGVSLDFYESEGEIASQHYAFLITETEFDAIFARICERGINYWADPGQSDRVRSIIMMAVEVCTLRIRMGISSKLSPGPMAAVTDQNTTYVMAHE